MLNPVKTIKTNTIGTINMLGLAKRVGARILVASSSEVYGDPEMHPQSEEYWGHVNPIGPRSCYDEGKRITESLSFAYAKQEKVDVRVARIFNTYGPRMLINDGRVVSTFISQALQNKSITVYGDGTHTRSFQFISDLIEGLITLMQTNLTSPVNLGNPEEYSIRQFASIIKSLVGSSQSDIVFLPEAVDDPQRRRPDISKAKKYLGWSPSIRLREGLHQTVSTREWCNSRVSGRLMAEFNFQVKYFEQELLHHEARDVVAADADQQDGAEKPLVPLQDKFFILSQARLWWEPVTLIKYAMIGQAWNPDPAIVMRSWL